MEPRLHGEIVQVNTLTATDRQTMYCLMDEFYDQITFAAFNRDLSDKDYCILLLNQNGALRGFSTQKIITIEVNGSSVPGVFSGDTIIHKNDWGSLALFKVFARYFIDYGRQYQEFYWFLISKGYKTYKMLPLFFNRFYPDYRVKTPDYEQMVLQSFGRTRFPQDYDANSGVICYSRVKDRLKEGVSDITARQLADPHINFFVAANPGYIKGNDLVCLARLREDNLKPAGKRLLLRK